MYDEREAAAAFDAVPIPPYRRLPSSHRHRPLINLYPVQIPSKTPRAHSDSGGLSLDVYFGHISLLAPVDPIRNHECSKGKGGILQPEADGVSGNILHIWGALWPSLLRHPRSLSKSIVEACKFSSLLISEAGCF